MFKMYIALFLTVYLALVWNADGTADESMEIRIFNRDFKDISSDELRAQIEKADLVSLGYRKIIETTNKTDFETGLQVKQETLRFMKKMHCRKVAEAEEMLNRLFPGVISDDVTAKVKSEIKKRKIESNPNCITGIEFHLKPCELLRFKRGASGSPGSPGSTGSKGTKGSKGLKGFQCFICFGGCSVTKTSDGSSGATGPPGTPGPAGAN